MWAADEIKKRTNGSYEIGVFPASQLGNENQINEGLGLGTVDMIYTGVAFAGSIHKPIAITNAPFVLRDFDHFMAYRASPLFREIAKGYEDKTKHKVDHADLLRPAHGDGEQGDQQAGRHEGHEAARAAGAAVPDVHQIGRRERDADRVRRGLSGAAAGTVDGQENPLPTIMAKKFYEVQSHIMLTGHITESLLTIVGSHVWPKLTDAEKKIFEEVLSEAANKATKQIRESEQKLADEFRKLGKTVVEAGSRGVPCGGAAAAQ